MRKAQGDANMLHDKRNVSLSKVILLKDAFSEEAVTEGIQIRGISGEKPVLKPGGYVLFLNLKQEELEVEIESLVYRRRKLQLRADRGEEVEEILLYPSEAYPVKAGSTEILGQAPPDAALWFSLEEAERECRLLCDYKKADNQIRIFQKGKVRPGKRNWYIQNRETKEGEYFEAQELFDEPGVYRLLQPLTSDYRKKDAALSPAFMYRTDESGSMYLLLNSLKKQEYNLHYGMCSGDTHRGFHDSCHRIFGTVKIQGQKQNRLIIP